MQKIKDIFRLFNLKWSQNSLFVWNSRTLQQPYHFQCIQFSLHLLFKRPKSNTIGIQEIHFWFLKENVHETFLMCSQQRKEIIYSKENHSRWRKELLKNRNNHTIDSLRQQRLEINQLIWVSKRKEKIILTYMHWSTTEEKFIGMIIVCDFFLLHTCEENLATWIIPWISFLFWSPWK